MSTQSSVPPPAGVPPAGNAKYAVVAILLVLGMGGLFAWRALSSQAPQPTTQIVVMPSASASVTAATTNAQLDDIPPPPPEEEKPEAGHATRAYSGGGGAGGCDKVCTGSGTPELQAALQVRQAQTRRCYNQALANDSSLQGHVSLSLRIGPSGSACSVAVASNDMGTPVVANCAAGLFRAATYPAPKGGCVDVSVALHYAPQAQ